MKKLNLIIVEDRPAILKVFMLVKRIDLPLHITGTLYKRSGSS